MENKTEERFIDQEFELPVELLEQVEIIAKKSDLTKNEIVAEAIDLYLAEKIKEEK